MGARRQFWEKAGRNRNGSRNAVIGKEADLMSSIRRDRAHSHVPRGTSLLENGLDRGPSLSIVVPSKDEAGNLPELVEQIVRAFRPLVERARGRHRLDAFEILVVDDGSTDETGAVLGRLVEVYPELRPISLAKNVGQSAATIAGFRAARGDWVGVLDADLQNPPDDLAKLWDALPGHDAALGWRTTREDVRSKRLISRVANRVRNWVLGQSIKDTGCSVRIFPREVALRLPAFHGVHRFFGPLLLREGCRIVQVPVGHRPRTFGKSHYHLGNRSIRVVVDLLGVAWLLRRSIRYEATLAADLPSRSIFIPMGMGRKELR
jgi:glycosyltransferase involved in cell wall biosynthesis